MSQKATLIIEDTGDPSVGIFAQRWEVPVPFDWSESNDDERDFFRIQITGVYFQYCEGKALSHYYIEPQTPQP
jgi:hypothetical protein